MESNIIIDLQTTGLLEEILPGYYLQVGEN